jgi:hypothetical protein
MSAAFSIAALTARARPVRDPLGEAVAHRMGSGGREMVPVLPTRCGCR